MACRMRDLELGGEPTCPAIYKVWSRNYEGEYTIMYEMDAATMKPAPPTRRRSNARARYARSHDYHPDDHPRIRQPESAGSSRSTDRKRQLQMWSIPPSIRSLFP